MPRTLTLGRDPSADILIGDPSISRRHAEIVPMDDQRIFVRDLGGANGTTLIRGGTRTPLAHEIVSRGDEVQFGDVAIDFETLHQMAFEKLGRAASPSDDDANDEARDERRERADDRRDVRHKREQGDRDNEGRERVQRGGAGADRGGLTKPGLMDFVPVGGFHLLKERGMLLPAVVFAVMLMRLMWLRTQPGPEPLARFLVEFTVSLAVIGFLVVYRLCGKRKPWKMVLAVMAMEAAIMSLHPVLDNPFCDATGASRILLRQGLAEGSIQLPQQKQPGQGQGQGQGQGAKDDHAAHVREAGQPADDPPASASGQPPAGQPPSGQAPGQAPAPDEARIRAALEKLRPSFLAVWYAYFCCAGLLEEMEKMLPVLILLWATMSSRQAGARQWGVSEPLDAIIYACAAALAFIMVETFGASGYVGGKLEAARLNNTLLVSAYTSFPLAIIRSIKALAGHLAYSGYFAYFIGLGILRPAHRERFWIGGWIAASLIHGLFDATAGAFFGPMVSVTAFFFLLAVIVKARQISPTRDENFATRAVPRHKLT